MPYIMCPLCGSTAHVSVADHKQWYEKRGLPFGSLVPHLCFYYCWKEINVGETVILRQLTTPRPEVREADRGSVKAILATKDGSLFEVGFKNGKAYYFIRAEIRPLIGSETNAGEPEEPK